MVGPYGESSFTLVKNCKLSIKVTVPFCVPTSNAWESLLLHSLVRTWCCPCSGFWPL